MHKPEGQRASVLRRWQTPVPAAVADDLLDAQFASLTAQVPVLLSVAALNTLILIATSWHSGMPFLHYAWMTGLIAYCIVRQRVLQRRFAHTSTLAAKRKILLQVSRAALLMMLTLGVVSGATYAAGLFSNSLLIPMSLGFGAISIAHCLYRVRAVALGTICLGIGPSALTLIIVGDFEAQMLAVSMISVAVLMMRFVDAQYSQLIDNLVLQNQIRSIANTDPLTGVANRRGVTALIDARPDLVGVGLALIDLDDFKQVNDVHGHNVGDALLQVVAQRLVDGLQGRGLIGRLGGDEFVAIIPDIEDDAALAATTTRMIASLCQPAAIDGLSLPIGASIGHALGRGDGDSFAALMIRADEILYTAKNLRTKTAQRSAVAPLSRITG